MILDLWRSWLLWRRDEIDRRLIRMSFRRELLSKRRAKVIQQLADLDRPLDYPLESR